MAEVYTLGSDTWREIPVSIPYIITFMKRSSLAINGCVHWLVISRNDHDYGIRFILSFNVNTDEFSIIETPSPVNNHVNFGFVNNLMVLGERLCFIYGDGLFRGEEIWVMKDYGVHSSWSKEYVFHRKVFHPLSHGCHEVMELQNKKLLLLDKMSNLGYFDLENKIFSSISVRNINNYPVLMDTKIKMDKRVDSDYFPIYLTGSLFSPKTGLMDKRVDFTIKKKMDKRVDSDSFPIYLIGELNYLATISACSV
ncbi:hypothetical protein IFM89_018030 [Coptis chinensis]|uniref:F-box associated beta-propeller type 3 domain-containing protein n=1 Tax=Coptis chinensis TaxID=261450 RepID=A0A835HWI5_9MAGN|nr:hypothetical protein IFM89_018030 [Coptis chinensis]